MKRVVAFLLLVMTHQVLASTIAEQHDIFPLRDVRTGMKGYGLTVFQGVQVEKFTVEVIDIMPKVMVGGSRILVRCSGPQIEKSGIFAGMSGSPVYFDDKLVGALAFTYAYARDIIGGITPIEEMLQIPQNTPLLPDQPGVSIPVKPKPGIHRSSLIPFSTETIKRPGVSNERTLIALNGIPEEALPLLSDSFKMHTSVPTNDFTPGAQEYPSIDAPLTPGMSVSIPLIDGDFSVSVAGTLTTIIKDTVLAFGHPFLNSGPTDFPLASSIVHTVIPSIALSFKIASPLKEIGRVTDDESPGIAGILGQKAHMIQFDTTITHHLNQVNTYKFQIADSRDLTPGLLVITLGQTLTHANRQSGHQSLKGAISIELKDKQAVSCRRSVVEENSAYSAAQSILQPVFRLLSEPMSFPVIEHISVEVATEQALKFGLLHSIKLDQQTAKPGKELRLTVVIDRFEAGFESQKITIPIYHSVSRENLILRVLSTPAWQNWKLSVMPQASGEESVAQVLRSIESVDSGDGIYVQLLEKKMDATVENKAYPHLPERFIRLLSTQPSAGIVRAYYPSLYYERFIEYPYVVFGSAELEVPLERK